MRFLFVKTARLLALMFGLVVLSQSGIAADVVRGKDLSQTHCARCHVVGDFNPSGGISSTPSFQLLAKRRPDFRDRFLTFYARRPHPAFVIVKGIERLMPDLPVNAEPVTLSLEDVDAIVAFVETLKPQP
ncbi:MAG: cytochrome c [Pseudomonadota bacterium]